MLPKIKTVQDFQKLLLKVFALLLMFFFSLVAFSQTPLPVSRTIWDAGAPLGWTDSGTGFYTTTFACSGSNGGQLNSTNDFYEVFFSGTPNILTYTLKISGSSTSSVLVEESADGIVYTTINNHIVLPTGCTVYNFALLPLTQYVRWTYTKVAQNVTIDDVNISQSIPCTPSSEPTTNSSILTFLNTTCSSIQLNWTVGNGSKRIVVVSLAPITGTPTDQTNYNANAIFGSGVTIAAGEFVVYNGAGNSVTITGLTASTTYYFAIFEYNGTTINCTENYFLTGILTGNTTTIACSVPVCPEITGILVDACGGSSEGINEFFTFTNGNNNLYLDSLTATFPSGGAFCNSGCGTQTWTTNSVYTDSLNTWAGCPSLFIEADPLPVNANVIVFTGANPTFQFDFSGLCGTGPYYAVFANNTNTSGRFANYNSTCSIRTLSVDFGLECVDTVGYDRCLLSSTDGAYVAFDVEGNPTYDNDGCTPSALLPIELVSFTGKELTPTSNLLEWITSSEINNDFFTLERSTDALNFETITTIKGAGNSNTIQHYNYVDATLNLEQQTSNTLYYRLKQTDFDGQYEYFDVIAISRKNTNKPIVFYYENQLHIHALDLTENVTIKIMDITGRTVYESVDKNTLINLSFLSNGIYIYQIVVQNKVFSNKFILE